MNTLDAAPRAADDASASTSARPQRSSAPSMLRGLGVGAVVIVLVWLAFTVHLPTTDQLQSHVDSLGWLGWLYFVGLYALVAATPIPISIMAISGGVLFGGLVGTGLSVVGAFLGCWMGYWIARLVGRDTVTRLMGKYAQRVENNLDDAGFQAVTMLRLLPGLPLWPVNYGSGAFGVEHRTYLAATMVATVPGQASLVGIGAFIANPTWVNGIFVGAAWITVLSLTVWSFLRWRDESTTDESS